MVDDAENTRSTLLRRSMRYGRTYIRGRHGILEVDAADAVDTVFSLIEKRGFMLG